MNFAAQRGNLRIWRPHMMIFVQTSTQSVGLAFGLSIAAGGCTCLGAAISGFARVNNNIFLAAAMAASAGVMM